jgi:hypothetical protein
MPSQDDIYNALGAVVKSTTGRAWWRKGGIQAQPTGPYATVFLIMGKGVEHDVVDRVPITPVTETSGDAKEIPWGTRLIECQIEFFRSATNDSASDAATRFKNSLQMQARFLDLWLIMGLVGTVDVLDIAALFRADTEPRMRVTFQAYANINEPYPLDGDSSTDIQFQTIDITHVKQDGVETEIPVDVDNNQPIT